MGKDHRKITAEELAKHASSDDAWIVVNGLVYDVTSFAGYSFLFLFPFLFLLFLPLCFSLPPLFFFTSHSSLGQSTTLVAPNWCWTWLEKVSFFSLFSFFLFSLFPSFFSLPTKDASKEFFELHRMEVLEKYERLVVGIFVDENGEPTVDQPTEVLF